MTSSVHRVQIEPLVVRNLFSFGHLLDREGEREGDGQGDPVSFMHPSPFRAANNRGSLK